MKKQPLQLKVKKVHPDAKLPVYATEGAACFDLHLAHSPDFGDTLGTGLVFDIPEGYVLKIYSRSGFGFKHGSTLVNSVGIIDQDYRGEVFIKFNRRVEGLQVGDRIAQGMLEPVDRLEISFVDEVSETTRGEGGLGSTGVK